MVELAKTIVLEILTGSFAMITGLPKVLIPLMIFVEILMVFRVMEKLTQKLSFLSRILGIQDQSLFPLLVGLVMGITYGAGTLIEINQRTPIPRRDLVLIAVFLFLCHAVVEAAMIYTVAGANVWFVSLGRLMLAFLVTMAFARLWKPANHRWNDQ